MNIDWELVAALVIIGMMLWTAFTGGRSNPVSTGKLEKDFTDGQKKVWKDIHDIKNRMTVTELTLDKTATKIELEKLRGDIAGCATSDELGDLSDKVSTVCEKVVGIEKSADRTEAGVKRIENFFLARGINGQ